MKNKKINAAMAIILIAGVSMAAYIVQKGKVLTATSTPATVTAGPGANDTAALCSVHVIGDATVFFMKNVDASDFVLTNAYPVASGAAWTFSGDVKKISYGTAGEDSVFHIGFE